MYKGNAPLSNINGSLVNVDTSAPGNLIFQSKVAPQAVNPRILPGPVGRILGTNKLLVGGTKNKKRKNNISKIYTMNKHKSFHRKIKTMKKIVKSMKEKSKLMRRKAKTIKRHAKAMKRTAQKLDFHVTRVMRKHTCPGVQKGGIYNQYQNNVPFTPSYSTGGPLSPANSALANPVPFKPTGGCIDNLNHFRYNLFGKSGAGNGFPSPGSY
jgi:hypothetical protein